MTDQDRRRPHGLHPLTIAAPPRRLTRRRFLGAAAAAGGAAALCPLLRQVPEATAAGRRSRAPGGTDPLTPDPDFPEGVAAGDPRPDGSVIWARVAPPADGSDVAVTWEVSETDAFASLAASGSVTATGATDHAVKVPVTGLDPDRWYRYRFTSAAGTSRIGRLRTAPPAGAAPERLRFAFCSCQQITDSTYVVQ